MPKRDDRDYDGGAPPAEATRAAPKTEKPTVETTAPPTKHPYTKQGTITKDGELLSRSRVNVCEVLLELGETDNLRFNMWTEREEYKGEVILDSTLATLGYKLESKNKNFRYIPPTAAIREAVGYLCEMHRVNPVADLIRSVSWDGNNRLATVSQHFGCDKDDELSAAVISTLIEAMVVKALHERECHYPYCPILFSETQGRGKTDALAILAPGGVAGNGVPLSGPDLPKRVAETVIGVSCVEFPELRVNGGGEQRFLRGLITSDVLVNVRKAYAREGRSVIVRSILVGTSNDWQMLAASGERRHPVVECGDIDLDALDAAKAQLWAEAAARYYTGYYNERNGRVAVRLPEHLWQEVVDRSASHVTEEPLLVCIRDYLATRPEIGAAELQSYLRNEEHLVFNGKQFSDAMQEAGWRLERTNNSRTWRPV